MPVGVLDGDTGESGECSGEFAGEVLRVVGAVVGKPEQGRTGTIRCWDELGANLFGQTAYQFGCQFLTQPGNLPGERFPRYLAQQRQGNLHRHSVMTGSRLEDVTHRQVEVSHLPCVGELVDRHGSGLDEVVHGEVEQMLVVLATPPRIELAARDDVTGDPLIVMVVQRLVVRHESALPRTILQLLGLGHHGVVVPQEVMTSTPVTFDQGRSDEDLSCRLGVDASVVDASVRPQRNTVQGGAFVGHDRGARGGPVWLGEGTLEQVRAHLLHPLRTNCRHIARPQSGGLHQLDCHDEFWRMLGQNRSGIDGEIGASRAQVLSRTRTCSLASCRGTGLRRLEQTDVRQQTREQGGDDVLHLGWLIVAPQFEVLGDTFELAVQILPLPDSQVVEVLRTTHPSECRAAHRLALVAQIVPQPHDGHDVSAIIDTLRWRRGLPAPYVLALCALALRVLVTTGIPMVLPSRVRTLCGFHRTSPGVDGVTQRLPSGVGGSDGSLGRLVLPYRRPVATTVIVEPIDRTQRRLQSSLAGEPAMKTVRLVSLVTGAFSHVRDGQRGDDDEDFP